MPRVKRGVASRARRKKVLKAAKGYYGARSRSFKVAKQAVIKAGQYAYRDRRQRKRQFRALWIVRINAAANELGISYSRLIDGLKKASIEVDRKVLADLAMHEKEAFAALVLSALLCALFAPLGIWSLMTNFVHYGVLAFMFLVEYLYRLARFRHLEHPGFIAYLRMLFTVRIKAL